jgi:hypothetical protein
MAPRTPNPAILSVGRALPPHHVDQETLIQALSVYWGARHFNVERLADVHRAAKVGGRNLALPLPEYPALDSFHPGGARRGGARAAGRRSPLVRDRHRHLDALDGR